jgi:hypothetical protein
MRRRLVSLLSIGLTLACNTTPAMAPDMGAPPDANIDAGNGMRTITLPSAVTGTMTATNPAMLSCVGHQTAPTPGGSVSFTLNLLSFGENGDHAPNTNVCFCAGNVFAPQSLAALSTGQCGTGCMFVTTDASGHATVSGMANGWYAYRVFATMPAGPTARTTFLDSIQINEPTPAASGATVDGNAVSALIANVVSQAELIPRTPATTTFAGRVRDCHGDNVQGAIVRAFHADGTEIIEDPNGPTSAPHYRFFSGDGSTPDSGATNTAIDGLYVGLNVPPCSHPAATGMLCPTGSTELVRLEAWAYTGTDPMGTAVRIGCEAAQAFPDGVSIVNIGPTRSDYPAGHPCHM